jgi:D-glycero-D-manno-heptose 1,7-bisphosphate phosphatase
MFPAIFLDRDGVIIDNVDSYVRSWSDVQFLPGSLQALSKLAHFPYKVVVVTNQSAVGRGIISLAEADAIGARILSVIRAAGGRVDGVYTCPHAPDANCDCRKPRPGLLLRAAGDLDIDLRRSIMVGDALSDLQAGQAAGVARTLLVLTGRGHKQAVLFGTEGLDSASIYPDLAAVVEDLQPVEF